MSKHSDKDATVRPVISGSGAPAIGTVGVMSYGNNNKFKTTVQVTTHTAFEPHDAPALPHHWIERPELLARAATVTEGGVVALFGMAGAGKSTLAARVAAETAPVFADGCFWIDLAKETAEEALARIALAFGHDIAVLGSTAARTKVVRSLLADRRILIVLANARTATSAEPFLPPPKGCAALITTSNDAVATSLGDAVVEVGCLDASDSIALLRRLCGLPAPVPEMAELAKALGGLPLALELAGKLALMTMRRPGFSWRTFATGFATGAQRLDLGLADKKMRAAFDITWTGALEPGLQRAFALLGLFEPGSLSTGEAAAAWQTGADAALAAMTELAALSLVRFVDAAAVQLHPLLADYAQEKAQTLPADERTAAHQRAADHLFERAPHLPRTLADIRAVLRSHYHAAEARDRERAERVYPWFSPGGRSTAVLGFLIDRGQFGEAARHERMRAALAGDLPPLARAYEIFWFAQALYNAGEFPEARDRINEAVAILDKQETSEGQRAGLSKFLMTAGHILCALGDNDAAESAYRRSVDEGRNLDASSPASGAISGTLMSLLQLGDLLERKNTSPALAEAAQTFAGVLEEAKARAQADIIVMAADRLARLTMQSQPLYALQCIREARAAATRNENAFLNRQGARYARQLGETAVVLACNGYDAADDALWLFAMALRHAGYADAQQELREGLYRLGNLFEHFQMFGRKPPFAAAWAAYALADRYARDAESPMSDPVDVETRIAPHMTAEEHAAAAKAIVEDPWGLIDAALAPLSIGWRPDGS